jgi:nitroreductase
MHTLEAINRRQSIREYDPLFKLSKDEILSILSLAAKAPSSWNLQPWRFVIIQDPTLKETLKPFVLFNTPQLLTSSALILVLNDLHRYDMFHVINQQDLDAGYINTHQFETRKTKAEQAKQTRTKEALAREGLFDCGLVTQNIMTIASDKGLDTCPMGGFDREQFMNVLQLDKDRYLPVVLLSIGKAAVKPNQSLRLPIELITDFR